MFLQADPEFAGCTGHFVDFVMLQLICRFGRNEVKLQFSLEFFAYDAGFTKRRCIWKKLSSRVYLCLR